MKAIFLTISLFLFALASFSQEPKKNGTIYMTHPYIDAVNSTVKAYLAKDNAGFRKVYADTARFWVSGMKKPINLDEAIKEFMSDFDYYDSVTLKPVGYPDYLNYTDQDAKVVQSWWRWSGKSKKTGEFVRISMVQFDNINSAGKIEFESIYGDFSKMVKE